MQGAEQARYVQHWRDILSDFEALEAFAVFAHGSVAIFVDPPGDVGALKAKAVEKMAKFSPETAANSSENFNVMKVNNGGLFTSQLFGALTQPLSRITERHLGME